MDKSCFNCKRQYKLYLNGPNVGKNTGVIN